MTSLVLPAYNPGSLAERTWEAVVEFVRSRPDPWEVLFVCDGCTDGTPARLGRLAEATADRRIGVLHYDRNRGKGHAVRTGLLAARGEFRLFTDVDLAYGFDDVVRVANALRAGAAVAIASREHPDSLIQLPPRHLGYGLPPPRPEPGVRQTGPLAAADHHPRHAGRAEGDDRRGGRPAAAAAAVRRVRVRLRAADRLRPAGRAVTEVPVLVRYEDAASTTGAGSTVRMVKELWRIRKAWKHGPPATPVLPTGELHEARFGTDRLAPEAKAA